MPAPIRYVQDSPDFPDAADVVVIGAGIAGAAATWYLAKQGLKVVLIEKAWSGPNSPAATGAGAASRIATSVNCHW